MVIVSHSGGSTRIVLLPNRSLSWRGNKLVLASLLLISAAISTGFAFIGAWVILPFAGLEMGLLSVCLYYVCWKQSYQQVLNVERDKIVIEKGVHYPKQSWQFDRVDVSMRVSVPCHDWDGPDVYVASADELVSLGEFLNKDDRQSLLVAMRDQRFPVRSFQIEERML